MITPDLLSTVSVFRGREIPDNNEVSDWKGLGEEKYILELEHV